MIFTKKRTYKQHDNEKDSFYKFSVKKLPNQNKITESFSSDICIIGAGLTGISSALHLANNGYTITVLEANKVGAGASGRNGGQLGIGMRKDQFFLENIRKRDPGHTLLIIFVVAKPFLLSVR